MHGGSCTSKDFASVGWVLHFVNFGKFTVTYRDEIQQNIYTQCICVGILSEFQPGMICMHG